MLEAVPMVGYAWIRGQPNGERSGHANPPYKATRYLASSASCGTSASLGATAFAVMSVIATVL